MPCNFEGTLNALLSASLQTSQPTAATGAVPRVPPLLPPTPWIPSNADAHGTGLLRRNPCWCIPYNPHPGSFRLYSTCCPQQRNHTGECPERLYCDCASESIASGGSCGQSFGTKTFFHHVDEQPNYILAPPPVTSGTSQGTNQAIADIKVREAWEANMAPH